LATVGPESALPILPISDIVLQMVKAPVPETVSCFADHLITAFREKG
jgi:hypothetical protein